MLREIIIQDEKIVIQIHKTASEVLSTWSSEVLNEWQQAFVISMRSLNSLDQKRSMDKSMQMCDKTQPLVTRVSGAYLIGKIVKFFKNNQLPIGWSQKIALMTQDFNFEVRQQIALRFKTIFKFLSDPDIVASKMVERFIEILKDEEEEVQCSAIQVLPMVLERLSKEQIKQSLMDCVHSLLSSVSISYKAQVTLAFNLGKICNELQNKELLIQTRDQICTFLKSLQLDTGSKLERKFVSNTLKDLMSESEENDDEESNPVQVWTVNQLSLCYNLPALSLLLTEHDFFRVVFPMLQNLYINPEIASKLSLVLPQSALSFDEDRTRAKMLHFLSQICDHAIKEQDAGLIKQLMQDLPLIYK